MVFKERELSCLLKLSVIIKFAVGCMFVMLSSAEASEYSPQGFYDVETVVLDNGLEVYLREKHDAKSVSIRLVVNVGHNNFACGKRSTAHFLEHLLFTGTSKHTEAELDALIEENGGDWNAATRLERTIYEINIYSDYASLALETLFEIISDPTMTSNNVETTRNIISRENNGQPTAYAKELYKYDIGKSGYAKASEIIYAKDEYCAEINSAENITREEILSAFKRYYVPNNMALIIVGDFESSNIKKVVLDTFNNLKLKKTNFIRPKNTHDYYHEDLVTGTLSPIIGNEAEIYLISRLPGFSPKEAVAFQFIASYLTKLFYNKIRLEKGLTYSTYAAFDMYENYGVFQMYADGDIEYIHNIYIDLINITNDFLDKPLSRDEFDSAIRSQLLSFSRELQSNSDLADTYSNNWKRILTPEGMINIEDIYLELTPEYIEELAFKYINLNKTVIVTEVPTVTYHQLYLSIGVVFLLLVIAVLIIIKRKLSN